MRYRVQRVSVHQSSKVVAILYGILGVFYVPFMFLANWASRPEDKVPALVVWLLPVILLILGYLMTALMFAVYNGIASLVGGVELTLTSEPDA